MCTFSVWVSLHFLLLAPPWCHFPSPVFMLHTQFCLPVFLWESGAVRTRRAKSNCKSLLCEGGAPLGVCAFHYLWLWSAHSYAVHHLFLHRSGDNPKQNKNRQSRNLIRILSSDEFCTNSPFYSLWVVSHPRPAILHSWIKYNAVVEAEIFVSHFKQQHNQFKVNKEKKLNFFYIKTLYCLKIHNLPKIPQRTERKILDFFLIQ